MGTYDRPDLGPIAEGDKVIVRLLHYRNSTYVEATVTKAARVWLTITENAPDSHDEGFRAREWRMRRDTQNTGSDSGYGESFQTPEQREWERRSTEASNFLFDQGISLRHESPWNSDGQRMRLADILRNATEETR